ncbi:toxin CcdB [Sphingobium sp. B2D3A]|uniref:CcdB family protein n=1 Tax=unclassified Sphingobium TaxID=2611147 RepID=UPI002224537A|nr:MULTISPECIES: CcdB family protein [unclassified Sphingobium]MCW2336405.1 toxin CcdB [Sphingobium sp. B2D3A]MCW2386159.1 toxin CcdB [Sphingobium sp. B2D3D]
MAQFDVYRVAGGALVVDCQTDSLSHFATRVVVPLVRSTDAPSPASRLHPVVEFDSTAYVLATHLLTAVPLSDLQQRAGSLAQ